MYGFYHNYGGSNFNAYEENATKIYGLKKLFSRVFLALFLYTIISQFLSTVIYIVASILMPAEEYAAFYDNYIAAVLISCAIQYLVAFPVLLITLRGTDKAVEKDRTRLSPADFLLLLLIGQALMHIGNLIGTFLNNLFGAFRGQVPENNIATIISEIPIWLIFVMMVVIGPIIEEIIFRKLLIDRLGIYGDKMAILFSAVAFGLIHGNLYQFFYATMLGALLGYVYTKTRDVRYPIMMHMITNFMGSIVALPVEKAYNEFYRLMELASLGEAYNLGSLISNGLIVLIYSNLQYGMLIGGMFALWHFFKNKRISISGHKEILVSDANIIKHGVSNVGTILFISASALVMLINLFLS